MVSQMFARLMGLVGLEHLAKLEKLSTERSQRFTAFLVGVIVLMAMWIVFALRILSAEAGI